MAFYLLESRDLAVALIPRCAHHSIEEWLGPDKIEVRNDDLRLRNISRRVAFIRNPLDRLISAFSLFYWLDEYGQKGIRDHYPIDSWEHWVDFVLDPNIPDDGHYLPQSIHVGNVPNIYHKLENLFDRFEIYRPGILPHNNKTTARPSTDYRKEELLLKYADDIALYQAAG